MLHEVPSRLTAATLFPRSSTRLLDRWRTGTWLVEHGDVGRLRSVTGIPQLHDIAEVLALGPAKISAYGLSATAPRLRRGQESVRTLQSIDHLTPAQALSAYDVGLSILCGDLLPLVPELEEQIEGLLGEFGLPASGSGASRLLDLTGVEPIEAVMSFSPAGADAALGLHYDAFDVISIQLAGTKVWMLGVNEDVEFPLSPFETETPRPFGITQADVAPPLVRLTPPRRPSQRESALKRIEMRPGSVLFVPRGVWHCTQEVSKDEPSVTLLLKLSPPSYVEVLITALFTQLSARPEWRAPCVGLFRPGDLRVDAMNMFKDLAAGVHLKAEDLLLKHYMRDRAPPSMLAFRRTDGATLSIKRATPGATTTLLRMKSPIGASEIDVDVALVPLCRWIATAGSHAMTYADACAHAGDLDEAVVWSLFATLEDVGLLEAVVESAPAAQPVVRRASKR